MIKYARLKAYHSPVICDVLREERLSERVPLANLFPRQKQTSWKFWHRKDGLK